MFCLLPKEIKNELQEKYDKLIPKLANVNSRRNYLASRAFNYIGGKSEDVSRKIISNFTEENDVVYDPCFGSGTFIISAALEGRKAIGVELDNYTYNMVKNLLRVHNKDVISKLYDRIDVCHFDSVMNLYETRCCGHQNYIFRFYFDPETENYYSPELHRDLGENAENIKLVNKCPVCDSKYKKYSKVDAIKLDHIECMPVDKFPSHKLIPNSRINITPSSGNDKYDSTFQRRSKIALLRIQRAIDELPDCKEKEFLQFALVSALTLSRTAQYGSSSYYLYRVVKRKAQESNVWIEFNKKFEYMLRYQGDYLADIQQNDLNNLTSRDLIKIINDDCKEITLEKLGIDKQVDLIYTDPPYTEQVPYLERHQLYRDWLREFYSDSYKLSEDMLEKEIVMTDSPIRKNKNGKEQYFKDIRKMFSSCYDLLKDYGIMVMHINLAKKDWLEIYNRFRNQARAEGFEPIFRYDIKNNDPTLRKQSSSANTSSFEIILFLVKLTDKERFWYSEDINLDRILYFIIKDFLHDDENLTKNRQDVISECVQFLKSQDLIEESFEREKIINIINKYFILDKGKVYVNDKIILFEDYTQETVLRRIIDMTPVVIKKLFSKKEKFTLDELLINLSYRLDDGNKQAINEIINNRGMIFNIINSLCIKKEEAYYPMIFSDEIQDGSIDIATLEGEVFEDEVVKLLREEGYNNVFKSSRTGDRGVDIYAKKEGKSYIFQVKRWVNKVDGSVIQRLHSMKENNNDDYAECITTSEYTQPAILEAEECNVNLIDGEKIIERFNKAFPGKYYHSLLNTRDN